MSNKPSRLDDDPATEIARLKNEIVAELEFYLGSSTSPVDTLNAMLEMWLLADFDDKLKPHRNQLSIILELVGLLFNTSQRLKYLEYYEGQLQQKGGPDNG